MCGIAGILHFNKSDVEVSDLKKMTDTIAHRGPDGEGQWVNKKGNVGFGHRRLSIIDLSEAGKQPMHYANNNLSITFNGEIYNYIELREKLKAQNYQFTTGTDTEVILAAYHYWGENCLTHFDGMFAFAIWDEEKQELFCARDRFGEKPFYYYKDDEQLIFASEMKALWEVGVKKEKNLYRNYLYLLYNTTEDTYDNTSTFYNNIYQLAPSSYFKVSSSKTITQTKYWDIDLDHTIDISFDDAQKKFRELFINSIQLRLRSDVAVGSSLSGGLDSSSIVMLIDQLKAKDHTQKTFSARFKNFKNDEGKFMQYVIDSTNAEAYFVYPTAESTLNNLTKILHHQEEPIGSLSVAAQFEVMQLTKKNGVTVLQDGQGADEILGGYPGYYNAYLLELYKTNRTQYKIEIDAHNKFYASTNTPTPFNFKTHSLHYATHKKLANHVKNLKSNNSSFFMGIHPNIVQQFKKSPNPLIREPNLKQRLYDSIFKRGLTELLRYSDRNAMANAIEVRLPFLSHHLVEFLFSLPNEYLLKEGWTKYILRKSLEKYLPQEITWRKDKIGYEAPQQEWQNNSYFKEKINASIKKLQSEKVINKANSSLNWQYLMLNSIYE